MDKVITCEFTREEIERQIKAGLITEIAYQEEPELIEYSNIQPPSGGYGGYMDNTERILRETIKVLKDTVDIQQEIINTYKLMLQEAKNGR